MFLGGGLTFGILLLALGVGYIVCYLANREEKALRSLGLIIGGIIIAVSAVMLLNNLLFSARMCSGPRGMGMMVPSHKMMMKGEKKAPLPVPQQQPESKK